MAILKKQSGTLEATFEAVFGEFADKWTAEKSFSGAEELERLAASFVFDWYFGARPDIDKLRYVYNNIFLHIPLWLQKLSPFSAYNKSVPDQPGPQAVRARCADLFRLRGDGEGTWT
jgi:hypothetical protein